MTNGKQNPTRFKDEIGIVPSWVFFLAAALGVGGVGLLVFIMGMDRHAPPFPVRVLLAILMGIVISCYVILIGYVNQDAGRRRMSRALWTLIAIFVPNGLGIVLYFVLRKPRIARCPQCDTEIEPGYSFCPRCRTRLQPVCPHCQHSVNIGDKFCPFCGGTLEPATGTPSAPLPSQTS
jgi:hypothetical protein